MRAMKLFARHWRLAFAVTVIAFSICAIFVLTYRNEANRAKDRVKIGMTFQEAEEMFAGKHYSGLGKPSDEFGSAVVYWLFDDHSEIVVFFKEGKVYSVAVPKPSWLLAIQQWFANLKTIW